MRGDDINLDLIRQASLAAGLFEPFEMILEVAHRKLKGASKSGETE